MDMNKWKLGLRRYVGVCALVALAPSVLADNILYRYEDDNGVKVLNHTIPPEFAQKGYEVLSIRGQVIEVVAPAPSESEVAQENAERELREQYSILRRRYSTIDDIERAKTRRLDNINTNISILRGNIGSINIRIENAMSKAAEMERAGRKVSSRLLRELSDSKAELMVAESSLALRLNEYENVAKRFEKDALTFAQGSKLSQPPVN